MPELPEVETTARLIRPRLEGRTVRSARVLWARSLGAQSAAAFQRAVVGASIVRVDRRAKHVVLDLARGGREAGHLFVHLGMSGRLLVEAPGTEAGPYLRVALGLDRGELRFLDVRKFGRFRYVRAPGPLVDGLGPEPLGEDFTLRWLRDALAARRRLLKPLLLDQSFVAGLGNIYVDEALFVAGLHPLRRSDRLSASAVERLHAAIRSVLAEAIVLEGSSFDAFYRTPEGRPGAYQHRFRVYGRAGRPCRTCGRPVVRIVVAQRGTHLCPRCQAAPRKPRGTLGSRR